MAAIFEARITALTAFARRAHEAMTLLEQIGHEELQGHKDACEATGLNWHWVESAVVKLCEAGE